MSALALNTPVMFGVTPIRRATEPAEGVISLALQHPRGVLGHPELRDRICDEHREESR